MTKHSRLMALAVLALGPVLGSYAATVSLEEAKAIASEFVSSRKGQSGAQKLEPVFTAQNAGQPLYYVFNVDGNAGFVMISAESSTTPVLGYSFEGSYRVDALPEAMKWMMSGVERELKAAPTIQSSQSKAELQNQARRAASRSAAKTLSTPKWSQEAPFNNLIPGRPLVGCVGTAMATVMKYYNYPASGNGSFGGVDFNVNYDWENMRADNYRSGYSAEEGEAVATLMYHASKSIDTQYAMSGSSAYEVRVPGALSGNFGYDPGVSYKKRSEVATQQAWDEMVKNEIDEGRPVIYCGQDVTAGHAFVCDGYEGEYLHFNWGWGGSADGYFLSTALNPTVSRTHHYNNLNTIIYNIKPAADASLAWSPIHITTDGNQTGIGSDLTDLASGNSFTVRVGNLKNLSFNDFNGKIAVALFGADGKMKALLSSPANFDMVSMGYLFNGYTDFRNCVLPDGVSVEDTDKVRIATLANGEAEWLPVAGELPTVNELAVNVASPASFSVVLPSGVEGVDIEGASEVIRGWNYSFRVVPQNSDEDVVTVKANGFVLTPNSDYTYTIANVCADQRISVTVQKASEVVAKRSVWVDTPGTLATLIPEGETGSVKELTIFGAIDARDFSFMKTAMNLTRLDLSGATICAHGSDQANALPREAFRGKGSLKEVILPNSLNRINNGAFRQCGITSITIPANVSKYEYNVFLSCGALRDIYVGRTQAEFINWCVLTGCKTAEMTLHVPNETAWTNYNKAQYWQDIANIVVDQPEAKDEVLFAVMEDNAVKFNTESELGNHAKGDKVSFTAEYIADNDNRMDVYANNTLLKPNAEGVYNVDLNGNTMIHFAMTEPLSTENNGKSQWSLTDKNGSIGLLTDAVNVIPGQEFTVRVNALNIPQYMDQFYWAIALTDSKGNIKEFISPQVLWNAGAADNHKFNVNCCVADSKVREGNQLRLVTSANNKKTWQVVKGANEEIVDALPALNNMNEVYNITVPSVADAVVSGIPESGTAVRGRDLTLTVKPKSAAYRINLSVNGEEVLSNQAAVNYTFVAKEDVEFGIEVFDPKADGVAFFTVAPGTFHTQLREDNVAATVKVVGTERSYDLAAALGKDFAINTIKTLDLSDLVIVDNDGNETNVISHPFFKYTNGMASPASVVQNIILPKKLKQIPGGIFVNCANIKEITLPETLSSAPEVGFYSSGSKKYEYSIKDEAFKGCNALTTIYIPGPLSTADDGTVTVCHHHPYSSTNSAYYGYYNLGHPDPKKVTIIVPEEYLSIYKTPRANTYYGNPWVAHGYNILSEYPVYGVNFDASRIKADADLDVTKMASFLGDNVSLNNLKVEGKLRLVNPEIACRVFDNGTEITPNEDGTIDVNFLNPAKNSEGAGNHNLSVVYTYDVNFSATSDLFAISEPVVNNESGFQTSSFEDAESLNPALKSVAENSTVSFKVDFKDDNDGLEARVMMGLEELVPDAEGLYTVEVKNAGRDIEIYAVPTNGATITEEELASLKPEESAAITSICLSGEMSAESIAHVVECFPELETLDLSDFQGELPAEAFAGMESLTTVTMPQVEEIPAGMFKNCTSLQSVDVSGAVNSIGAGAFEGCQALETLRLTGITSLGEGAFSGCDNLTTITLLSGASEPETDETQQPADRPARAARRAAVHQDAFKGLNPNCIVILDKGVEIPGEGVNFLRTEVGEVTELINGVEETRQGRIYTATDNVTFLEGYPLSIPHAFTLVDGATVTFETTNDKWTALVVPFDVQKMTDAATGEELELTVAEPRARVATGNLLYTLKEDAEAMESVNEVKANVPYFFYTPAETKVLMTASDMKVPATPAAISVAGKDYSLHATYTNAEVAAGQVYLLDDGAYAFVPAGNAEETITLKPFEVYATSPASVASILSELPYGDMSVEVAEMFFGEDTLKVAKEGSLLAIYAAEEMSVTLYTVDGKAVKALNLEKGRNAVELPAGLYILNGFKFRF